MPNPLKLLVQLLVASVLVLAATAAWAEDGLSDPLARELKATGDAAMQSLRYEEALASYERATEIEAHPILLFNRARALQALQRYPEALEHFEAFRQEASPELLARAGELDALVTRLRQQVSTLEVVCNVKGATVLVRGKKVGTTPLENALRLNAGSASISVTVDGHYPYKRDITLPGAGSKRIEVQLVAKKTEGRLTVRSPVAGALVYVDDEQLGTVPAEAALESGRHRIRVEHPGHRHAETTVEITKGDAKQIDIALEKNPGLLKKWWFWTGAGVVLAGGVGVTIALTTERKADSGDIPPGTISAPLLSF